MLHVLSRFLRLDSRVPSVVLNRVLFGQGTPCTIAKFYSGGDFKTRDALWARAGPVPDWPGARGLSDTATILIQELLRSGRGP